MRWVEWNDLRTDCSQCILPCSLSYLCDTLPIYSSWIPPELVVGVLTLSGVPLHFSSQDAAYSNFSSGLECTINTRFALTSGEKNVAASQRGVRPPCTSVITGKIPHMYMSIQTSHSREGENAANTAALLISPPPPCTNATTTTRCRGPRASQMQECVAHANAVMNVTLRPALSSSLESWWNVNINHVGRSTSQNAGRPEGISSILLLS